MSVLGIVRVMHPVLSFNFVLIKLVTVKLPYITDIILIHLVPAYLDIILFIT